MTGVLRMFLMFMVDLLRACLSGKLTARLWAKSGAGHPSWTVPVLLLQARTTGIGSSFTAGP